MKNIREKGKMMVKAIRQAVSGQPSPRLTHNLIYITLGFILVGLLIFLSQAYFDLNETWDIFYYLWDSLKDTLLLGIIWYAVPQMRPYVAPVWIFILIRACTEILILFNLIRHTDQIVISGHFWICSAAAVYLTLQQVLKEWKSRL